MGLMDKFRRKNDDNLGDLSDLGDFGLDDNPGSAGIDEFGEGFGGTDPSGDLPSPAQPPRPGMHAGVPTHMEEVLPSPESMQMGARFGVDMNSHQEQERGYPSSQPIRSQQPQTQAYPAQHQQPYSQQQYNPYQQNLTGGHELLELTKDIEIIHAKLDSIKSSLDSVNQRLATLERIAGADSQQQRRYSW